MRFVGQYDNRTRDALRDPRTGEALAIIQDGRLERADKQVVRDGVFVKLSYLLRR